MASKRVRRRIKINIKINDVLIPVSASVCKKSSGTSLIFSYLWPRI